MAISVFASFTALSIAGRGHLSRLRLQRTASGARCFVEPVAGKDDLIFRLAGVERTRVWRLYLRSAGHGFEAGDLAVYQVRARRPL